MDLIISIKGVRIKAKRLDNEFYEFIKEDLAKSGVDFNRDNSVEAIFTAYLRLAAKVHDYDKEIENIINEIES
ncbi:MAG: hypothetical protein GXN91_04410 [Epsilonproteobacteria bacterium]|nr:hypothetical protein [Campylobacterota bacterium]